MNDDELLDAVARAARDELKSDPLDVRWDDVPGGTLTEDEIARLASSVGDKALAERAGVAFAPVDGAFHDTLAAAAVESYSKSDAETQNNVVELAPRRPSRPWLLGLAASVTLALGVTLATSLRAPDITLPGYSYELRGTAQVRSATQTERVRRDQNFELLLTPATAVSDEPSVALYRVDQGALVPVTLSALQIADSGPIRLTAAADQLPLGQNTLHAFIAADGLPATQDLMTATLPDHTRRVVIELLVEAQR